MYYVLLYIYIYQYIKYVLCTTIYIYISNEYECTLFVCINEYEYVNIYSMISNAQHTSSIFLLVEYLKLKL